MNKKLSTTYKQRSNNFKCGSRKENNDFGLQPPKQYKMEN
jgi:hypothetical protein